MVAVSTCSIAEASRTPRVTTARFADRQRSDSFGLGRRGADDVQAVGRVGNMVVDVAGCDAQILLVEHFDHLRERHAHSAESAQLPCPARLLRHVAAVAGRRVDGRGARIPASS